jgi:hemerythrin-like domain-containing protein
MDAMDILINEHVYIKKVIGAVKKDCEELAEGKPVNIDLYKNVIDFVRNYADRYHHMKEEKNLFNLISEQNESLKTGVITGMLLEHDLGRMYIKRLEEDLIQYEKGDISRKAYIIASALSYSIMLEEHIDKEDTVVYNMARRVLEDKVQGSLLKLFNNIEESKENKAIREKYINFANSL